MSNMKANMKKPRSTWFGRRRTSRNHLIGKVVLLVGQDAAVLHSLAEPLARKGADIAVLAPEVPPDMMRPMRDTVESAGQRFLHVGGETGPQAPDIAPQTIMETVTASLGHLDVFIDLSAQASHQPALNGHSEPENDERDPDWPLVHAALEQIAGH